MPRDDLQPVPGRAPGQVRYRYHCRMRWGDMDAQGHINNAYYLDYLQEARVAFLLDGSAAMQDLLATGVLVVSHQLEYLRPIEYGTRPLTIELWVDALGGSRFVVGYDVYDGQELAARARTGAVPFDLATNSLRRLSAEERARLSQWLDPQQPLRPLPRVRITGPAHRFPLSVRWSDLDSYGHVNNVKYFDYLQEARIAVLTEALDWSGDEVSFIVRQDLEYLLPIDFRTAPYEVATVVADVGSRSFRLASAIRDPQSGVVFATARSVVVGATPLTAAAREALERWVAT